MWDEYKYQEPSKQTNDKKQLCRLAGLCVLSTGKINRYKGNRNQLRYNSEVKCEYFGFMESLWSHIIHM